MTTPTPDVEAALAEHEPVLGLFGKTPGIVGCSCLSARDYRAAGHQAGQEGYRKHLAAALRAAPQPECDCYPGGFTPDSYEGVKEDCPVHGRAAPQPDDGALTDEDRARIWDQGHRLAPPHSDRCEPTCPNPYRAAQRDPQPSEAEGEVVAALDSPPESEERRQLRVKWANHYGHDGQMHSNITSGCLFGSALRDDVCQPNRTAQPSVPAPPTAAEPTEWQWGVQPAPDEHAGDMVRPLHEEGARRVAAAHKGRTVMRRSLGAWEPALAQDREADRG